MLSFYRRVGEQHSVRVGFSDCGDGDARENSFSSAGQRTPVFPHQVHGSDVAIVENLEGHDPHKCDALITLLPGIPIGVRSADCVPIALYGNSLSGPALAVVHAGWRGIRDGVIGNAAELMTQYGCYELRAIIGPHISADEYEFGTEDLAQMVTLIGERAASWTKDGLPALDLRAAVEETLSRSSVIIDHQVARCTAQDPRYWSYRASGDDQRFALVAEIRLLS